MMDTSKRRSQLWNFFIVLDDDGKAVCKYCEEIFSYKSSISNLKRHLQRKHPFDIPEQMRSDDFDESVSEEICSVDIVALSKSASKKIRKEAADKNFTKQDIPEESTSRRKSATWKHFSVVGEDKAACNYCQKVFSYRSSISNLKKHFERKHLFKTSNYVKNEMKKKSGAKFSTIPQDDEDSSVDKFDTKEEKSERKQSDVWKSFKLIDDNRAICVHCKETFSCRNSITNLKIHLQRKHSEEDMDRTENNNDTASTNGKVNVVSEEYLMVQNDAELFGTGSSENTCKDSTSASKSYSVTWNLFIDQEDGRKVCCLCSEVFSAGSSSETLKEHLQNSHPEYDNEIFLSEDDGDQNGQEEIIVLSAEELSKDKKSKDKKSSELWQYFSPREDDMAACNLCGHILSHRSSTSNLKKHLSRKHPMINFETVEGRLRSSTSSDPLLSKTTEEPQEFQEKVKGSRKFSKVWDTFTMYDDKRAKCNLCNHILSYKTTVSNLKKHYLRKHGGVGKSKRYTTMESSSITLRKKQATLLPRRKVSSVWRYFSRQPGNQALCLLCKKLFVYKFNTSNLKKHLLRKHSRSELNSYGKCKPTSNTLDSNSDDDDDYSAKTPLSRDVVSPPRQNDSGDDDDDDSTRDNPGPASPSSDTDYVPLPEELIKLERQDEKSDSDSDAPKQQEKVQSRRRVSKLWKYFTPQGNSRALCHICKHLLMYKSSTTNLKRHLMRKHARKKSRPIMKLKRSPSKFNSSTENENSLFEIVSSPPRDNIDNKREMQSRTFKSQGKEQERGISKRKSSSVWKYFTEQEDSKALCHICKKVLKFRSTTTNLKKHLMRKHPRRKDNEESRSRSPLSENVLSPPPFDQVFAEVSKSVKQNSKHSLLRPPLEILSFFSAQVTCDLCGKVLVFKSIGALESHLKDAHEDVLIKKGIQVASKLESVGKDEVKDTTVKLGRKRSPLWKYFTPKDESYAECKTCEQVLSYRSSTNNLTRHLERKHPDVMKIFSEKYTENEERETSYLTKEDEAKANASDSTTEAVPVRSDVSEQIVVATEYGDIIVKRLDEDSQ